jgi:hypothetical protein
MREEPQMQTESRRCEGCGVPLVQPARGRRKWCSERCRKRACYSGECVECGARTYSGNAKPSERCVPCASALSGYERARGREERVMAMREEGLLNTEIAERLGCSPPAVASLVHAMRLRGRSVPATRYGPSAGRWVERERVSA